MWCIVNLPNGTQQAVKCDPKAIGQECLEKVCKALNIICEMEYFGLEHWQPNEKDSRTHQWINLRNRLSQDSNCSGNSIQLMLALRVKFWVPVHLILQESVRNIFYMQAKVDLLERRLNAKDWNNAARLSALLSHADGIRFNEECLTAKYPMKYENTYQKQQNYHHLQHQDSKDSNSSSSSSTSSSCGKKDKEPQVVLAFKKRRLSKQKSMESFDLPTTFPTPTPTEASTSSSAAALSCPHNHQHHHSLHQQQHYQQNSHNQHHPPSTTSSISCSCSCFTANSLSSSSSSTTTTNVCSATACCDDEISPLLVYEDYIVRPFDTNLEMPNEFLRQISQEHSKLAKIKMSPKSAKYWLLKEIQDLPGFGEEVFSGVTVNESSVRCDISVGAHGLVVSTGDEKNNIPFSAIAAAKSFRRTFKLEYLDDHSDRKELEIKLPKHALAAGLYRSITERHAFYVCDKVRVVVTTQFTRDLKGTIASMFKEDTELGKRYVFDIQRTCREVHDQARRILYERGIEVTGCSDDIEKYLPAVELVNEKTVEDAIKLKEEREAAIERCVDTRITEAMTCKICMDKEINAMFNPCRHVTACSTCAGKCDRCPICRAKVINVVKVYLPSELRTNNSNSNSNTPVKNTITSTPSSSSSSSSSKITSTIVTSETATAIVSPIPAANATALNSLGVTSNLEVTV